MLMPNQGRPDPSEHAPYYGKYIALVQENDILAAMEEQRKKTADFLRALPETSGDKRYAPGKWTVKQVVGHLIDIEKLFAGRALYFARGTRAPLPGIEQEDWMNASPFGSV